MKKIALLNLLLILAGCQQTTNTPDQLVEPAELTVYTYDSLNSDYGLLPQIQDTFESDHIVRLNVVSFSDTGAMVNQLVAEQNNPQADVVLGIDQIDLARYSDANVWMNPTAFDYGHVGFVYDTTQLSFPEPISLEQLATDPAYTNTIILEQPGLSSPGTQFMLWSQAVFGDDTNEFWQALEQQTLTVAPDWNTAYYSMFLNGEAPIVLSYLTSPAYHLDQEQSNRYAAIPISDGYFKQTEYAAVITNSDDTDLARAFVDYLTTDAVQNKIPTTQWMMPVAGDTTTWPAAYQQIIQPTPKETLSLEDDIVQTQFTNWLTEWDNIFGQ